MEPTSQTSMRLGVTTILAKDDKFSQAYQAGYQRFLTGFKGMPLTDSRIYDVLARNINDVLHTDRENAGYVVGWLAALLETGKHDDRLPVANWQQALELEWK
jgi:hypothetical protein